MGQKIFKQMIEMDQKYGILDLGGIYIRPFIT